jgi:activator of 2-hydroxyglutaryl-CoA dehydratase
LNHAEEYSIHQHLKKILKRREDNMHEKYSIGIDFGTDSVRALVVNINTGEEVGTAVSDYRRWADGKGPGSSHSRLWEHYIDQNMEG